MFKKISFLNLIIIATLISLAFADYCDLNCKKCASETVCEVCEEDLHRILKEGKCVCEDGHKENARFVCESTDKTINIILLVFCIIFIIGFIYYVFNIDKINPLSFCTMLIFKHHPIDPSQKKLVPVNQDTTLNFTTTLPLQTDGLQNNLKNKQQKLDQDDDDVERQKQAVQDMEDIIGKKNLDEKQMSINDIQSKQSEKIDQVVGIDNSNRDKENNINFAIDDDDNEKKDGEQDDDKLDDSDDISDFGNDDNLDKENDDQDKNFDFNDSKPQFNESSINDDSMKQPENNNNKEQNDIVQNGSNVIQDDENFEFEE